MIIIQDGKLYPVEIKKTGNPKKDMINNFEKLSVFGNIGFGTLISLTDKPRLLTRNANAISIWDI